MRTNRYGLSRNISADVRRQVRQLSKFGCVICRRGFYQYEHIDPPFEDARYHDPEKICCLCGACHDAVTRGQLSKQMVIAYYREIQELSQQNVAPPIGPLDFHDGSTELLIGGLLYSPSVRTILRYYGQNLICLSPSNCIGEPGTISAIFTDDVGNIVLRLEENEWIGSLDAWDIEIVGQLIKVRQKGKRVVLQLRLAPPGKIIVERLDMRIDDCHVLATEKTYAVGRYIDSELVAWAHASIVINKSLTSGAAIEFTDTIALVQRDSVIGNTGKELANDGRTIILNSNAGILIKPMGLAIASMCGSFSVDNLAIGPRKLQDMRKVIIRYPNLISRFIATGKLSD